MIRLLTLVSLGTLAFACSSSSDDNEAGGPVELPANPCATPGATYLSHLEQTSGNCPDIADSIINVTEDGKIPSPAGVTCQVMEQDGCTAHNSNCKMKVPVNGGSCTFTFTTSVTFEEDGSSASGLETLSGSCSDGSSCSGTFKSTFTRQN